MRLIQSPPHPSSKERIHIVDDQMGGHRFFLLCEPRQHQLDVIAHDADHEIVRRSARLDLKVQDLGVNKGTDVSVLLGAGRMLKEFDTGITGMRAGERRELDVRYPDEYHNKSLAGRVAHFDVQMKTVEEKHLPELDDEFCREYGVLEGGIAQLRSEVADNMRRELEENIRNRVKNELLERLLEANPVEVPRSLVDAQIREMQIEAARRMGAKDVSQLPPPETFADPARRRVALGILIGEIIKTRGIRLDRARVESKLSDLVAGHPEPEALLKVYRQNQDAMRQVENAVLEDQVVDDLLSRANVVERPSTFREIMNFGA